MDQRLRRRASLLLLAAALAVPAATRAHGDEEHGSPQGTETQPQDKLDVNRLADDIAKKPEVRASVATRIKVFIVERKWFNARMMQAEGGEAYLKSIQDRLEGLLQVHASSGAWISMALGGNDEASRNDPKYKNQEEAIARSEQVQGFLADPHNGYLQASDSAAPWLSGFIHQVSSASILILTGKLDVPEIYKRDKPIEAPGPGEEGKIPQNGIVYGAGYSDMLPGKYKLIFHDDDGPDRELSVRVYALENPEKKGQILYKLGFFDVTNADNVHGRYIPLDQEGSTTITLTDSAKTVRSYTVSMIPKGDDTTIQVVRDTPGAKTTKKLSRNELIKERAEQAARDKREVWLGDRRFYATPQAGKTVDLLLYDADRVDALLAGQLGAGEKVLPRHIVAVTEKKDGELVPANGGRSKIIGSGHDLVFDKSTRIWKPAPSGQKLEGEEGKPDKEPVEGQDDDFEEEFDGYSQSDLNAELAQQGAAFRIYEEDSDGPFIAVVRKDGKLQSMKVVTIQVPVEGQEGKTESKKVPAYCCGSAFKDPPPAYIPGELELVGRTLVHASPGQKTLLALDNPYKDVGTIAFKKDEAGDLVADKMTVKRRANAGDAIEVLPGREQETDEIVAAMDAKLKELGGDFKYLKANFTEDGWTFAVVTTKNAGRPEEGVFAAGGKPKKDKPKADPKKEETKKPQQPTYSADKQAEAKKEFAPAYETHPRLEVNEAQGFALYGGADDCVVQFRILDGQNTPVAKEPFQVYQSKPQPLGVNVCQPGERAKYEVKSLVIPEPYDDIYGTWEGANFVVVTKRKSDNNRAAPPKYPVLVKK